MKVSTCALAIFSLCAFLVDVLSWQKGVSHSVLVKFYKTSWLYFS